MNRLRKLNSGEEDPLQTAEEEVDSYLIRDGP
jgi:hypothetical protein